MSLSVNTILLAALLLIVSTILVTLHLRRPGFGAMFTVVNMGDTDIHDVSLSILNHHFSSGMLLVGEHSMNGFHPLSRYVLPDHCEVHWKETPTAGAFSSTVSLDGIPKVARTGMLLIIRHGSDQWTVEYLPDLDLNRLRHYHEVSGYNQRSQPPDPTQD